MHVTILHTCGPSDDRTDVEAEDIEIEVDLPFPPFQGMLIKATPEGDFLKVQTVLVDVSGGQADITLHIEEPEDDVGLTPWPVMAKEGWRLVG